MAHRAAIRYPQASKCFKAREPLPRSQSVLRGLDSRVPSLSRTSSSSSQFPIVRIKFCTVSRDRLCMIDKQGSRMLELRCSIRPSGLTRGLTFFHAGIKSCTETLDDSSTVGCLWKKSCLRALGSINSSALRSERPPTNRALVLMRKAWGRGSG